MIPTITSRFGETCFNVTDVESVLNVFLVCVQLKSHGYDQKRDNLVHTSVYEYFHMLKSTSPRGKLDVRTPRNGQKEMIRDEYLTSRNSHCKNFGFVEPSLNPGTAVFSQIDKTIRTHTHTHHKSTEYYDLRLDETLLSTCWLNCKSVMI